MATATAEGFYDDYKREDIERAHAELNLLANEAHEPETTEDREGQRDEELEGGLAVAVRGVGHYGPERRVGRYMQRRQVLGNFVVLGRELPPGIYGVRPSPHGPTSGPRNRAG